MANPVHPRQQIRDAVIARLVAANTLVADRVFGNRMQPLWKTELPAILVYTESEPSKIFIEAPRTYERNLQLNIEIVAAADEQLDDNLDTICAQVEACIFIDETFGGLCADTLLTDTSMAIVDTGDKPLGAAKISLEMPYQTALPAGPATELNDLDRTDVKFDNQTPGNPPLSEDILNMNQGGG